MARPTKKPDWVIQKERARRAAAAETLWLFGLHAVEAALKNPDRAKVRLVATQNAAARLADAIAASEMEPEIADPRKFPVPLDAGSVHQGVALEVRPLDWPPLDEIAVGAAPVVVALDRVSDPHNAGAILRSAEVFGAAAVIGPARHSAPETGALAKAASGALERMPYVRVRNLGNSLSDLQKRGFTVLGLDADGTKEAGPTIARTAGPLVLVLGAEGPGLRARTRDICDDLVRINPAHEFGSLNVSNAAAVALFAAASRPAE